ncbi:hypothetical protein B0H10DRAFT_2222746 [Mycena sp. CBHHK59/15]|nr:hypothetical protein B0H10DRAFT_2222746 [Mycena sp. CBHHK59/15]
MSSEPLHLLDLPTELVVACLAYLDFRDIESCLDTGNRLLRETIENSVLIQYQLAQEAASVRENPERIAELNIAQRIIELQRHEATWLNFAHEPSRTITLDFVSGGIYDLASDLYLAGKRLDPNSSTCHGIKYAYTSPGSSDDLRWTEIDVGKPIVDFGSALTEHNLIAIVTRSPCEDDPQWMSLDVMLLDFSTGKPHELATNPIIHIHDIEASRGPPGITMEIVGENLALLIVYWHDENVDMDTVHVYDWKLGTPKMDPFGVNTTGIIFLTEDTIIIPDTADGTLGILYIPPSSESDEVPHFIHSFSLPALHDDHAFDSFQCRAEPNPCMSICRASQSNFTPRAEDSLILFSFDAWNHLAPAEYIFVVPRSTLLALLRNADTAETPWDAWGPQSSCWPITGPVSKHYITTTAGQRMVTIAADAWEKPAPIRVLDFNPRRVAAQRRIGPVDGEHATVRVMEAGSEKDVNQVPFSEPVWSTLPYVETLSKEKFDFRAVMINDEDIIGVRYGEQFIESLHVLHFG